MHIPEWLAEDEITEEIAKFFGQKLKTKNEPEKTKLLLLNTLARY